MCQFTVVRYQASPEAQRAWGRIASLLRIYWFEGVDGLSGRRWSEELGVRVDGSPSEGPMALLEEMIAADQAMEALRRLCPKAHVLACADVEEPQREWHTPRGTGVADLLRLELAEAIALFECAKEYLAWLVMGGEKPEAAVAHLAEVGRA